MLPLKLKYNSVKRGDTIIEVMFAVTIFCLVAVLSIAMMNSGVMTAENALETVTARNELNAQAEALRFIHSSYISEKALPYAGDGTGVCSSAGSEKCQQYRVLWETITSNAISASQAQASGILNLADLVGNNDTNGGAHAAGCDRVYEVTSNGTLLSQNNAFVINTRDLSSLDSSGRVDVDVSYISARSQPAAFVPAPLNARIIYTTRDRFENLKNDPNYNFDSEHDENSTGQLTDGSPRFVRVAQAEGIWVIAVAEDSSTPRYYDFYIESCWYGPNTISPTAIDTVIRLYNPENVN